MNVQEYLHAVSALWEIITSVLKIVHIERCVAWLMCIKAHSGESVPFSLKGAEAGVGLQILGSLGALISGLASCRKRRPALL